MALKLGSQTGSVTNHIYSRMTLGQPDPVVGMGVTFLHWTDRSAGTIIEVFKIGNDLAIKAQGDNAERTDKNGFSEDQTYEYTPNPKGAVSVWRFRNGAWEKVFLNPDSNRWKKSGGGLIIGKREAYWDPCF